MHRSVRAMIGAAAGTLALAAGAAPALADGFTLKLSAPATPVVGKSMVLQATGTMPPEDIEFPYYFSLDAIPTAVTTTCPPDRWEGVQFAQANGGTVVVLSQMLRPDASGDFSVPVAVTPTSPGSLVLCGYVDDGSLGTQAAASLPFDIQAAAPPPGRVTPAVQVVRDIRSCRALLSGKVGRRCVHRAVKRANGRCRKLKSHRRETRCLRSVRRAARSAR